MSEVRITDPVTGGQKGQKPERFDLMPFDALEEVARVYGAGASKYEDWNWLRGYKWSLSLGALIRHVARFSLGEDRDPETGCLHLAHAAWHCLTIIAFFMRGLGTDDRKKTIASDETWSPSRGETIRVIDYNCLATVTTIFEDGAILADGDNSTWALLPGQFERVASGAV